MLPKAKTQANEANSDSIQEANENTPLLIAPLGTPGDQSNGRVFDPSAKDHGTITTPHSEDAVEPAQAEETPIPYQQALLLCFAALADPIAYFTIFPFINEMLERTGGVEHEDVGFWAGLIESLFSLVQMVLMIFYGRASDRLGRKPVLVFSLVGIGISTALFGLSQELWVMIVLRCVGGVFGGSVVTIRTMMGELTNKETQGKLFSWYMFARNVGLLVGPAIGGGLANPAKAFPSVFGGVEFFETYPYALATFVAGSLTLISALVTLLFVNETLTPKVVDDTTAAKPPLTTWQVLKSPGVPMVLFLFEHISLISISYTAVSSTFMYTDIESGGFTFSDQKIAIMIMDAGISQAAWTLLAFPYLQRTFGTGPVMRACSYAFPFLMLGYPLANELLRHGHTLAFWIMFPTCLALGSGVAMLFTGVQLCINDISPSREVLSTMNALSLTINSAVRAFAPVCATSVFAAGVKWGWADGHLIWVILVLLGLILVVACYNIPEAAEGRPRKRKQLSEDEEE